MENSDIILNFLDGLICLKKILNGTKNLLPLRKKSFIFCTWVGS